MNSGWFKGPVLVGALVVVAVVVALRQGHDAPAQSVQPLVTSVSATPAHTGPTTADVRDALAKAGISGATVRAATAADPAAPGYVVAAVPHGKACVLITVGDYFAASVSVVGQLPGGTCLAQATR